MMLRTALVALALTGVASAAGAATVSQTQTLTDGGQDFTFLFTGLAPNVGGGTVTISPTAGGTLGLDLSGAFPDEDENFSVAFDGTDQGSFSCGGPSNNMSTAIPGATDNSGAFNDCAFTLSFDIAAAALTGFLADGLFSVGLNFGDDVSTFGDNDEITVSLSYEVSAVPLPAAAPLLLAALGGLGVAAKRRRKAA